MMDFSRKVGFEARLRDGSRAWIRPVQSEDKARIQRGMKLLSSESRYLRFFNDAAELGGDLLHYLTEVNQRDHVAWIAVNPLLPGEPGIGIARFVTLPNDPCTAELAITVVDEYQGLGLGAALMNILLVRAEQLGVRTLRAIVLPDNYRVLRWMRRLGATSSYKDGLIELNLAVEGNHVPELEPAKTGLMAPPERRSAQAVEDKRNKHMALAADG